MFLLHENRPGVVFTGHSSSRVTMLACHTRLLPFIRGLYVVRIKLMIGLTSFRPVRCTGQSCNVLLSVLGAVWLPVSCVTEAKTIQRGQSCAGKKRDHCAHTTFCDTDQICSKNDFFFFFNLTPDPPRCSRQGNVYQVTCKRLSYPS